MLEENKDGLQETTQEVKEETHCENIEHSQIDNESIKLTEQTVEEEVSINETTVNKELFIVKSTNEWIEQGKKTPIPRILFDKFWFENELCILFADTNLGKSILAVQIGNSISKGQAIPDFALGATKQKVVYFDFELSTKQFQIRYCDEWSSQDCYTFDENFVRIEFNPNMELPKKIKFEDYLIQELEKVIIDTESKIVIVDNITYLKDGTEKANDALPLMKKLKALKHKYDLSILALAHTPKRDLSKPLIKNDLQGSKMLMNLCDSSFAIGESHADKDLRYLKQIKQRNCEQAYNADNVVICEVDKSDNFLQFKFMGYGRELEHLKPQSNEDKIKKKQEAAALKTQGLSNSEIGRRVGVSEKTIRNWFK